jgi:hypothetical protein
MDNLRGTLTDMANTFAMQLLGVVREATVQDVRKTLGALRKKKLVKTSARGGPTPFER